MAKDIERFCQKVISREPAAVRVLRQVESAMEVQFELRMPVVLSNGWITLFPGEENFIEVDVDGDRISNPRAVRKPANSAKKFTFKFWQECERLGYCGP